MPEKPLHHGRDHRPGGEDPTQAGPWHDIGADGEPAFVTGLNASPTGSIPNPVPMRFRIAIGPPNVLSEDGTTVEQYTDKEITIQGDITGVSAGDTVFVLPLEYRMDYDVPYDGHDDAGSFIACRLLSTGEFVYGTA